VIYCDGKICDYYELKNYNLKKITSSTIHLQNQFKNGGQSANRLRRNRDIQREQYITLLAEKTVTVFYDKTINSAKISNLIFCGPAQFKIEISEHSLITSFFAKIGIHIVTMQDSNAILTYDWQDLVDGFDPQEIKHLENIRHLILIADNKLVFGDEITQCLETCQIRTLYIHHSNDFLDNCPVNYGVEIIKIKSDIMVDYGGMIGIKFWHTD
jgi:peptide subunit release factor 1 (eRF1)